MPRLPAYAQPLGTAIHALEVCRVRRLTDDSVQVGFEVPAHLASAYQFNPGQHLTICYQDGLSELRRPYSICNASTDAQLSVAIKRLPEGTFSVYANERLKVGDRLRVMTPMGHAFDLPRKGFGDYGVIAAGSGITPILSIISSALLADATKRWTLLYINRSRSSTMFLREIDGLADRYRGRFTVRHWWTREADGQRSQGRMSEDLLRLSLKELGGIEKAAWLLCGPFELMLVVGQLLQGEGFPEERVHREVFTAAGTDGAVRERERLPELVSEVSIRFRGRVHTFRLSSNGLPILLAGLGVEADLPFSCREGVCASCRARVLAGRVIMDRNLGLDRRELESGFVLACQAHPCSDRVVLDFDPSDGAGEHSGHPLDPTWGSGRR